VELDLMLEDIKKRLKAVKEERDLLRVWIVYL
jgi:hypothetical protein